MSSNLRWRIQNVSCAELIRQFPTLYDVIVTLYVQPCIAITLLIGVFGGVQCAHPQAQTSVDLKSFFACVE